MSVYVLYDVVSMFMNDVMCDQDIPVLRSYPDSTSHWNHKRRWLGGDSRRRFIWLHHVVKKNLSILDFVLIKKIFIFF